MKATVLDFFAGSGLATEGLKRDFSVVWANDICEKKAAVYAANHSSQHYHLGPIEDVSGQGVPPATLSWASFPCQDLSLAGNLGGIQEKRSGLVWQWLRVMDEMPQRPSLLVAENVLGLLSAANGRHYALLHHALIERGYRVGAVVLDAVHWVPQSRPRVFVIGVDRRIDTSDLEAAGPTWIHPRAVVRTVECVREWVWWDVPRPRRRQSVLEALIDFDASCDPEDKRRHNLSLIPRKHRSALRLASKNSGGVFPGYKRVRPTGQALELRFDGVAGCLRTPQGGSSRQFLVIVRNGRIDTRLLTVREAARLMGAPDSYKIPGTYNQGYKAMGDGVVVPVVRHVAKQLLAPLARRISRVGTPLAFAL